MARVWRVRRAPTALPAWLAVVFYAALVTWAAVVLFPLYWIVVTSFKLPIHVYAGPVYLPFVDFMPSLHAWRYLFVDLRNDTLRPFENTVIVALVSSTLALVLGTGAGYGLLRFHYRPRLSAILLFTATAVLVIAAMAERVNGLAAIGGGGLLFLLVRALLGRSGRTVGNDDIALWLISQRMLPPVAVVIPIYVMFQRLSLLDTRAALIITYTPVNLPLWGGLVGGYFAKFCLG